MTMFRMVRETKDAVGKRERHKIIEKTRELLRKISSLGGQKLFNG